MRARIHSHTAGNANNVMSYLLLVIVCLSGCSEKPSIRRYQVAHETSAPPGTSTSSEAAPSAATTPAGAATQRMLAAMIPSGGRVWFVKLTGPETQVGSLSESFQTLVTSFRFATPESDPSWTMPTGWTRLATPGPMRFATLKAQGLDVSISSLPVRSDQGWDDYLAANANRWRGQLHLPAASAAELKEMAKSLPVEQTTATLFDWTGTGTGTMATGPATPAGLPPSHPPVAASNASPADDKPSENATGGPTFETPADWKPGRMGPFRLAAFDVQTSEGTAEVTLTALGPAAGDLLSNVNRWREQIGLAAVSDTDLSQFTKSVTIDGIASQHIDLVNGTPKEATKGMVVIVIPRGDQTFFLKMSGDRACVLAQLNAFEQFAGSLRLPSSGA